VKRRWFVCALAALFVGLSAGAAVEAQTQSVSPPKGPSAPVRAQTLEGAWAGSLQAGEAELHLVLHISKADDGSLKAALDSLDQGVYGIEVSSFTRTEFALKFEVASVNASYVGKVSADRHTIDGTWSQGAASLPLIFHRQAPGTIATKRPDAIAAVEGVWQGALETNGMRFRLQLHISHDTQGQLVAGMDSIDQGINGFPATNVTQKDSTVRFDLPAIGAAYDGTLNAAKNTISGHWQQGDAFSVLTFKRSDQILELRRPQTPAKPYPYVEEEIVFPNAKAGTSLAGTLTLPRAQGPFAAAILLAGSGPLDRDEADSGHRPFLILADYLTRKGIAVLRYDKRGIGKSTGNYDSATTADFASDAEAALAFLRSRKQIDGQKIGIIGHSEGAMIAPLLASRSSDVAWMVMLAGPATSGEQTMLLQSDLITRASGMSDEQVAKSLEFDKQSYLLVRQEKDRATLENKLGELVKASDFGSAMPPAFLQRQIHWTSSPWFRYFLDYEPAPALEKTKCPVLALSGEKDLQVPPKENFPIIQKLLEESGNKDVEVVELPGLNHLFQHCQTGLPAESRAIEETFAPEALAAISSWVLKHTSP
jgi:uncharacterized protein